jgi:hypothetical protein
MGSILGTRIAGKQPAREATAVRTTIIASNVAGSVDVTPKSRLPGAWR